MSGLFDFIQDNSTLDSKAFDALEAKVSQVIDRLRELQAEKQQLERQLTELQERQRESEQRVNELVSERERLLANQRDFELEETMRSRIRVLLEKLEGI